MSKVLKTLVQANAKMASIRKELATKEFTGSAGGGAVVVTINGQHEPLAVTVTSEAISEGAETVQELVLAALRAAYNQADSETRAKTEQLSKALSPLGLSFPR